MDTPIHNGLADIYRHPHWRLEDEWAEAAEREQQEAWEGGPF